MPDDESHQVPIPADDSRDAGKYNSVLEREFAAYLGSLYPDGAIRAEPRLGTNYIPDFIINNGDRPIIVEVKGQSPLTQRRMRSIVEQLKSYRAAYEEDLPDAGSPQLAVAVPHLLVPEQKRYFAANDVSVFELPDTKPVAAFPGRHALDEPQQGLTASGARSLIDRLHQITPGKDHWPAYQRLCGEILRFLFYPALAAPRSESANASGVNRRDYVLPNYAEQGFWKYMQQRYLADYVVVDAKNFKGPIKKKEILQLANYLTAHGTGLFGMIMTRQASDRSAEATRREQWSLNQKLIIILNDDDLERMLEVFDVGGAPEEVVRQKIEDFRLSF